MRIWTPKAFQKAVTIKSPYLIDKGFDILGIILPLTDSSYPKPLTTRQLRLPKI